MEGFLPPPCPPPASQAIGWLATAVREAQALDPHLLPSPLGFLLPHSSPSPNARQPGPALSSQSENTWKKSISRIRGRGTGGKGGKHRDNGTFSALLFFKGKMSLGQADIRSFPGWHVPESEQVVLAGMPNAGLLDTLPRAMAVVYRPRGMPKG